MNVKIKKGKIVFIDDQEDAVNENNLSFIELSRRFASAGESLRAATIFITPSAVGRVLPFSQFITVLMLTSSTFAKSAIDKPKRLRSFTMSPAEMRTFSDGVSACGSVGVGTFLPSAFTCACSSRV